ncbi:two-component regulator propeller domain-containing protein [Porifericola rhodea]|uniref:ligand-binding sensor domain-containing protein n=1 Tax=Porifericola rhodea TaxID=930972 RepID=UPI0026661E12|nr:two-component regulator propeller domain-containing protein [Porifericola rhodea]WKN31473.1 two-component regulator propeller domain-containing protein [Porifericola rhodea]
MLSWQCLGQTPERWEKSIRFDRLPNAIQDSLSQKQVNCLLRHENGTTWFGTKEGLLLYNGQEILTVKDTTTSGVSIEEIDIQTLMQVSNGDIWIGTENHGAICYSITDTEFKQYQLISTSQANRTISSVLSFCEGKGQRIWAGTFGGGVYFLDKNKTAFRAFEDKNDSTNVLSTSVVMDLHEDRHGIIWGATFGNGLIRIDPHYHTYKQYSANSEGVSLPTNDLFCLEEGEEGTLWIGTYGHGMLQYDRRNETFNMPFADLESSFIESIQYYHSYLWIATQNNGLWAYDSRNRKLHAFQKKLNEPYSLLDNHVSHVSVDAYGTLWVITEKGVNIGHAESFAFTFFGKNSESDLFQPITALTKDNKGDLWVGTANATLYQWAMVNGAYTLIKHTTNQFSELEDGLTSNIITALEHDDEGGVWLGTSNGAIARWDQTLKHWVSYQLPASENFGNRDAIESIYQDSQGRLWIGVLEKGLFFWDREQDSIRSASQLAPTLGSSFTPKVFAENNNYLWIGTISRGLIQLDKSNAQVVRYNSTLSDNPNVLSSDQITGLVVKNNNLWIGTFDKGVCRLNITTGGIEQINESDGLFSNQVTSLSKGNGNDIWVGSVKGISAYNTQNSNVRLYSSEEYLGGKELMHFSFDGDEDKLYYGALTGVLQLELSGKTNRFKQAPLLITRFSSKQKNLNFNGGKNTQEAIHLSYDDNAIEISFALQQYLFTKNHQYEYRLEGLENEWKAVGHRTLASYTNLSPGTYKFYIRARADYGNFTNLNQPLIIIVHPAWYQTLLFRVSAILVVLGIVVAVYYYRIASVEKHNRVLEAQVAERTRELTNKNEYIEKQHHDIQLQNQKLEEAKSIIQQKNDDLQHLNEALEERVKQRTQELAATNEALLTTNEELDLFVYRAYHDIIGPIARIEGLCQLATLGAKPETMEYLEKLQDNCLKARTTLQKVLQIHHVRHHEINQTQVSLQDLITQIYETERCKLNDVLHNISFTVEGTLDIQINTDLELMTQVLTSLLNNAIQYSHSSADSWIKVKIEKNVHDELQIVVEDNGEGIVESVRDKVFSMFFRGHETKSGTGLGLYIARLALEKLNGTITYEQDNTCTRFTVVIDTNENHAVPISSISQAQPIDSIS